MGYLSIQNLYQNQDILMLKECYAMEKIHGTSAHIAFKLGEDKVRFFSGGETHEKFISLFDEQKLLAHFKETYQYDVVIFGEAYGGKQQAMSHTYGKELKFIVFDVKVGDFWLDVPKAEASAIGFGLEFVDYVRIPATVEAIDAERDRDSTQAVRNGMGAGRKREGVVLRPLIELRKNNGDRIISKHKGDEFRETATPRTVDPERQRLLTEANDIADEWVTLMRLEHVLDKFPGATITDTGTVIKAMVADVYKESVGEIVQSKAVEAAIGKKTAIMFKQRLQSALRD